MQVEVITGADRRRRWTREEKEAVLNAAFARGAVARAVARQNDISSGQLYSWRKELWGPGRTEGFARVTVAEAPAPVALPLPACDLPVIEVVVRGHKVRIPPTMPPALATAVLRALVKR
jgi:transposase